MADEVATPEQVAEYESQLAGIEQLLEASPNDDSLLALKKDLEELLALTKGKVEVTAAPTSINDNEVALELPPPPSKDLPPPPRPQEEDELSPTSPAAATTDTAPTTATTDDTTQQQQQQDQQEATKKKKKKKRKLQDFVIPSHLIIHESDSATEQARKKRATKALKNKWRHEQHSIQSQHKQQSWQSFQKKTKTPSSDSSSIFATGAGVDARVGVISKKTMTEFGSRKRHKK